jgi:hypothetical protein
VRVPFASGAPVGAELIEVVVTSGKSANFMVVCTPVGAAVLAPGLPLYVLTGHD